MTELKRITDLKSLMEWRAEVIGEVFGLEASACLLDANREYFRRHIAGDSHLAYVASVDGQDAGCGAVCLTEELPSPDNPTGRCGYLMNIYVREPFRKKGVAHHIVRRLIDEAKKKECGKIYLETTGDGYPVYGSLGLKEMPDMMKYYDDTES